MNLMEVPTEGMSLKESLVESLSRTPECNHTLSEFHAPVKYHRVSEGIRT